MRHFAVIGLISVLLALLGAAPGWAQDGEDSSVDEYDPWAGVEEMTVISSGSLANIAQATSTAITAFDSFELDRRRITGIDSLGLNVPNIFISKNQANPVVTLRGIGSTSGGISADEAVAVHIDGVYIKRPLFLSTDFFDLGDLQVRRGPQGSRGGKNSTVGSLNFVSQKPQEDFGASVDVTVGTYNQRRMSGFLNVPVTDKVLTRMSWFLEKREAYNKLTGRFADQFEEGGGDDAENVGFRGHIRFLPTESVELLLSGNYFQQTGEGPAISLSGALSPLQVALGATSNPSDVRRSNRNIPPDQDNKIFGGSATLTWDVPRPNSFEVLEVTMIGAWERVEQEFLRDGDLTDVDFQELDSTDSQEQWSFEGYVDLETGPASSRLGFWMFDERFDTELQIECPRCDFRNAVPIPGTNENQFLDAATGVDGRSYGVFGELAWSFDETWTLTSGIRYSWDERNGFGQRFNRNGGGIGQPFGYGGANQDWDGLTARLNLEWAPTEDTLFYVEGARGYRSGGLNLGVDSDPNPAPNDPAPISPVVLGPYDPEYVWLVELGTKNEVLDKTLRLNASFFFMNYTDLQVAQPVFGVVQTDNVAEVQNFGIEIEGDYEPVPGARIDYTLSWQHARALRGLARDPVAVQAGFVARDLLQDLGGNQLPNAPDLTVRVGVEYEFALGRLGRFTPRVQYFWQDETYYRIFNTDLDLDDDHQILDVKATWATIDDKIMVELFVDNVLDEDMIRRISPVVPFGVPSTQLPPQVARQSVAPRAAGIKVRWTY